MSNPTLPRTNLERELVRIWEKVLLRAPIGIHDNFFDLGGTSLEAVRIFSGIEELIHQRLPLSLILGAPTIEKLAASLIPGKSRDRKASVVPIQPEGEKPIFFCIGGGVMWRPLSEHLGPDQPVLHVGLDPRAVGQVKGKDFVEKVARHMICALSEKQPKGPYYLGGFCSDGAFAYEVARQLKMYGHEIGLLALFEPFTPSQSAGDRVAMVLKRIFFRARFRLREFHRLSIREIPQYARYRWEGLKRMSKDVLWRSSARSNARKGRTGALDLDQIVFVAASAYRAKPLDCPTVIFHCKDWPMLSAGDPYFGWRKFLTGRSETVEIPGDHMGILREPSVGVLAEKLKACLENTKQMQTPKFDVIPDGDPKLCLRQSRA